MFNSLPIICACTCTITKIYRDQLGVCGILKTHCLHVNYYSKKHSYSKRAYNELTLTANWFSLPLTLSHVKNLTNITNYANNEPKLSIPDTSL